MIYDKQFIKIAKDAEQQPIEFDAQKALKGATLASVRGEVGAEVLASVENFKSESGGYSATVDGIKHYFDYNGDCTDDDSVGSLAFVASDIQKDLTNQSVSGDSGGDDTVKATISSLNPRDYFAQEVMNGFMKNVSKPFELSDADIYKYTTLSYKIAQSMINVSAFNREADPEEGESTEVQVDTKTLNGNTEKLLNNISVSLNTMAEASEGGGGGESTFDGNLTGWPTTSLSIDLGRGNSSGNPLYVTTNYPSRNILPAMLAGDVSGFLVYGASNLSYPHGYFTFDNLKGAIVNYLTDDVTALNSLAPAILNKLSAQDIYDKIESLIKNLVKQFAADLKTSNPSIVIPSNWSL